MARDITVTFDDGSSHVYQNAPDNITPDQAFARAQKDFSDKKITGLDGGRGVARAPAPAAEPTPESQSIFRQVADVPLHFATGVTQGVRMVADAFGATNPISKSLRGVEDYIGALYSAQSKQDAREMQRIMKEAEDKGVADQVLAGVKAFSVAPVDTLTQVFGNAAPAIAGGMASYLLRGGAMAAGAVGAGTGAAMGAGSVKGSIYDATKQVLKENTNMSPEQIEQRATLAQEYGGKNLDMILAGTALGTLGSTTGIEPMLARQLAARIAKTGTGKILEREALEQAEKQATKKLAERGAKKQAAITAAEEAGTEFAQESQEQIAQNIAEQREGFETPTYRGAVAAGTLGALSAVGPGGVAGGRAAAQAQRRAQFEDTPEGRQLQALDELVAQEEKKQRVEEINKKKTPTKAEKSELAALQTSLAQTQEQREPAAQEEMTVPEAPAAPTPLQSLEAQRDSIIARVDSAQKRIGMVPEALQDDLDSVNEQIRVLTQGHEVKKTDAELAAEEARLEREAIQAEQPAAVTPTPDRNSWQDSAGNIHYKLDAPLPNGVSRVTELIDQEQSQNIALKFTDSQGNPNRTLSIGFDQAGKPYWSARNASDETIKKNIGETLFNALGDQPVTNTQEYQALVQRVKAALDNLSIPTEPVAETPVPPAAPNDAWINNFLTRQELLAKADELAKESERLLDEFHSLPLSQQHDSPLRQKRAEIDAEHDRLLDQVDALDAARNELSTTKNEPTSAPDTGLDVEAVTTKLNEEGTPRLGSSAIEALEHGDEVYAFDLDNPNDVFNINPDTAKNLQRLTTPEEVEAAARAKRLLFSLDTEAGNLSRADAIMDDVRVLEAQQQKMLSKSGRMPAKGTKKRAEWDAITDKINKKKTEWAELTSTGKPSVPPSLLPAGPDSAYSGNVYDFSQAQAQREIDEENREADQIRDEMARMRRREELRKLAEEIYPWLQSLAQLADKARRIAELPMSGRFGNIEWALNRYEEIARDAYWGVHGDIKGMPIGRTPDMPPLASISVQNAEFQIRNDGSQIQEELRNYVQAAQDAIDTLRNRSPREKELKAQLEKILNNVQEVKFAAPEGATGKGLHPSVAEAIRNDDLNGALKALAQNTSGFARELAIRLAELNLPTNIVFGQQRRIIRKVIDAQTAQQQTRMFMYVSQMYPDVYDKYFKNFDREENLEKVLEGLQELSKPKYNLNAVKPDFDTVVKVFGDTVPHMNAPGFFSPTFDIINLNPHPHFGTSNRVFLHEVVHAATEYFLSKPAGASLRQLQAVAELGKLFRYARARISTDEYGFTSISEFVAEAMSNPDFQRKLKSLHYAAKTGSLFSRFKDAVRRLLGFDNVAAAAAIEIDELFSAYRPATVMKMGPVFAQARKDKSVGYLGKPGNWKAASDAAVSIKDLVDSIVSRHPDASKSLKELAPALWDASGVAARKTVLPFLQLRQLADLTASKFPQLGAAIKIISEMVAFRGRKLRVAEEVLKKWAPLQSQFPAQSELMSRLMLEATIRAIEIDPDGPGYNAYKVPQAAKNAWKTLKPEFKQIYREVREFYSNSVNDMIKVMKERAHQLSPVERDAMLKQIDDQFGPDKLVRPYFPLRRFGEYWFQVGEGENKEFYMFESATARNLALRRRRRELEASDDEKQQELASTLRAGNGISTILSQNASTTKVLEEVKKLVDSATSVHKTIEAEGPVTILSEYANKELKKELNDSLNQLIYILLPQQSMRKMFINRRSVQGASNDMLRVFAQTAVHSAYQQARYKYSPSFINNIQNAHDYVNNLVDAKAINAEQQQVYNDYIYELEERSKTILGVEDKSAWARAAGRITETTFFFMLTAPASAILNIIGMHAVTMPYIGGRFGYKEANALMLKNLGRYLKTAPTRTIDPLKKGEYYNVSFPSIVEGGDLPPLLQRAAQVLVDDGDINISTTNDAMNMAETPSALYTGRLNTVKRVLSAMFHQSERLNREVAMLTTFELAYNKLKNEPKTDIRGEITRDAKGKPVMRDEEELFNDAIAEAREIAGLTLGDYTRQMKGRRFTTPGMNVLLQFKQYAITTTYIILRNLYLSLGAPLSKGELDTIRKKYEADKLSDAEIEQKMGEIQAQRKATYKEARRRLAGILGMAFLYGGATALPFFSMLGPLVGMFGDDEDDDDYADWQNDFINGVEDSMANAATALFVGKGGDPEAIKTADAVGRAIGHMLTRGPLSTITGSSLSDRVSFDVKNLWFREGRFSPDIRESLKEDMIANVGPAVGLLFNWVDAYQLMQEGQVQRAFETALPAIVAKPITAWRLGTEGATTKSGNVIGRLYEDEFSAWELAMQMVGIQPEKLALAQKTAIQAKGREQRIIAHEAALLNRAWMDYSTGSPHLDESLDALMEFGAKYPTLKIDMKKVKENFDQRMAAKVEAEAIGAKLDKRLRNITEPMLYSNR